MKRLTTAIAILFLIALSLIGVAKTHASALGLPDGNYIISFDFSGTMNDVAGTLSVGPGGLTTFHVRFPGPQSFDCNPCVVGTLSPDSVFSIIASHLFIPDNAISGNPP